MKLANLNYGKCWFYDVKSIYGYRLPIANQKIGFTLLMIKVNCMHTYLHLPS